MQITAELRLKVHHGGQWPDENFNLTRTFDSYTGMTFTWASIFMADLKPLAVAGCQFLQEATKNGYWYSHPPRYNSPDHDIWGC